MNTSHPLLTWIARRTPRGYLEALAAVSCDELARLAIQAGLLGVSLRDWLVAILEAASKAETKRQTIAGECIELDLPDGLVDSLKWQCWNARDEFPDLEENISSWFFFISQPGPVMRLSRSDRRHQGMEQVAQQLIRLQLSRAELYPEELDQVEDEDRREFEAVEMSGAFRKPMEAALGSLASS